MLLFHCNQEPTMIFTNYYQNADSIFETKVDIDKTTFLQ